MDTRSSTGAGGRHLAHNDWSIWAAANPKLVASLTFAGETGRPAKRIAPRQRRGRTRAGIGPSATVVNGTASGKSSACEWISTSRMIVPSARVSSSIAK